MMSAEGTTGTGRLARLSLAGAKGTLQRIASRNSSAIAPTFITVALFVANAIAQPSFVDSSNWAPTLAVASPFVLTALAQAPPMLSGNGGLDLSVGPFAGFMTIFVAIIVVPGGISAPASLIPLVLAFGFAAGALNGVLISYCRLPPIIATLGTYLFYAGISTDLLPSPGGSIPSWLTQLDSSYGPIPGVLIVFAGIAIGWNLLIRTAFHRSLLAVGGDDRAAYTAGINVALVRLIAYALAGMLAALAGLLLAGAIGSGDATVGPNYSLTSIAAVALGGISLAGGRGGLFGAAMGGAALYLIQNLLTVAQVSVFQLDIANGVILLAALAVNGSLERLRRRGGERAATRAYAEQTIVPSGMSGS